MRELRCTIDSSCVIALEHLNLLPQLSFLFSRVLVPKAVRMDLFKRRGTKDRIRSLFDTYAFFQRCDGYETGAVDFLLAERMLPDEDDLVRKGVGWLLKEAYAAKPREVVRFLKLRSRQTPRIVLRIAAEKMSPADRTLCLHKR